MPGTPELDSIPHILNPIWLAPEVAAGKPHTMHSVSCAWTGRSLHFGGLQLHLFCTASVLHHIPCSASHRFCIAPVLRCVCAASHCAASHLCCHAALTQEVVLTFDAACMMRCRQDVYSFGVVLWEVLTWRTPFEGRQPMEASALERYLLQLRKLSLGLHRRLTPAPCLVQLFYSVANGEHPEMPDLSALPGPNSSSFAGLEAYVQLMLDCWDPVPEARPPFHEIIDRLRQAAAPFLDVHALSALVHHNPTLCALFSV